MKASRRRWGVNASASAAVLVVAGALAWVTAHGRPAAGAPIGSIIIVQAPAGTAHSPAAPTSLRDPIPSGSRLLLWDPAEPGRVDRVLTPGFAAAGAPALSADATRLLFTGRRQAEDAWSVFEVELPAGEPQRVTPTTFHAHHADYMAGDRIVFASDRDGRPDPKHGGAAFSLYTCALDGSELQRITFNPGSDVNPTVLRDGRVLYSAWQPPCLERPDGAWALFTIRNDGTGILPFRGSHDAPVWKSHARELSDGRIVYLTATANEPVAAATVAMRRPLRSRQSVPLPAGFEWLSAGGGAASADEAAGVDGAMSADGAPADLIAGLRPAGTGTAALYLVPSGPEVGAAPRLLFDDPDRDDLEGVAIRSRLRPRGIVSDTRPGSPTGTLLCLDARRTDRIGPGETTTAATAVRIFRAPAPDDPPEMASSGSLVAEVPLLPDGSFLIDVPADTPLRFESIDDSGRVLLDSHGWVWVRPGEQRSCIGCHEDRETAPSNRVPMAVLPRPTPPAQPAQPAPEASGRIALGGSQ